MARLAGTQPTTNREACGEAGRKLAKQYNILYVLITLGADGAILILPDGQELYEPSISIKVVDTTGAGDCCRAAFVSQWCAVARIDRANVNISALQSCLRFAVASAAICCTRMGAMPSLPSREEVETFLTSRMSSH